MPKEKTNQRCCANCIEFRLRDRLCTREDRYRKCADSCKSYRPRPYARPIAVASNYREV